MQIETRYTVFQPLSIWHHSLGGNRTNEGKYWSVIRNGCVLTNRKYTLRKTNALKKEIWPTFFWYSTSSGYSIINVFCVDSYFFSARFSQQMEQMKKRIKNGNAIKQHTASDKLWGGKLIQYSKRAQWEIRQNVYAVASKSRTWSWFAY